MMTLLGCVNPQPPSGIKYCVGGESWLPARKRTPVRMVCEEWGHLGPMVLDPTIQKNAAGLRVRVTEIVAPKGAKWFTAIHGTYFWTKEDSYELMRESSRSADADLP